MKYKFVNVWDYGKYGRVPHIILQVEEKDDFLTKNDFNPGYKIVIRATKGLVGAAGGHTFNPYYYEESVQKRSRKIDSNESDVLGFYLSHINDIYDVPTELYTEEFWSVLTTSRERYGDFYSELSDEYGICEYNYKDYYKLLVQDTLFCGTIGDAFQHIEELLGDVEQSKSLLGDSSSGFLELIQKSKLDFEDELDKQVSKRIEFLIIDKETMKIEDVRWSSNSESTVADYLWCPLDELPDILWDDINDEEGKLTYREKVYDTI